MNTMLNYDVAKLGCDAAVRKAVRAHAFGGETRRHVRRFRVRRPVREPQ